MYVDMGMALCMARPHVPPRRAGIEANGHRHVYMHGHAQCITIIIVNSYNKHIIMASQQMDIAMSTYMAIRII